MQWHGDGQRKSGRVGSDRADERGRGWAKIGLGRSGWDWEGPGVFGMGGDGAGWVWVSGGRAGRVRCDWVAQAEYLMGVGTGIEKGVLVDAE